MFVHSQYANCYYTDTLCCYRNRFAFMTLIIFKITNKISTNFPGSIKENEMDCFIPFPKSILEKLQEPQRSERVKNSAILTPKLYAISCLPTPTTDSKLILYRFLILIFFHAVIRIIYCIVC